MVHKTLAVSVGIVWERVDHLDLERRSRITASVGKCETRDQTGNDQGDRGQPPNATIDPRSLWSLGRRRDRDRLTWPSFGFANYGGFWAHRAEQPLLGGARLADEQYLRQKG